MEAVKFEDDKIDEEIIAPTQAMYALSIFHSVVFKYSIQNMCISNVITSPIAAIFNYRRIVN